MAADANRREKTPFYLESRDIRDQYSNKKIVFKLV